MSAAPEPAKGDCFTAALTVMETATLDGQAALLAHGLPLGRGPENNGERYWHAWVETKLGTTRGRDEWFVLDLSNGRSIVMLRHDYYRIGRIDPRRQVWRYSWAEAQEHLRRDDNRAGPWVPGWEEMGL